MLLGACWLTVTLLLVLAAVFEVQRRDAARDAFVSDVAAAAHRVDRAHAETNLLDGRVELDATLHSFDDARAEFEATAGRRDEAAGEVDQRRHQIETLRGELFGEGLRVVDQGVHLNELVLCLKAGERAFNALAGGDRATAEESLRSADAECRSSSEFVASRAGESPTAPASTEPTQ